MAVKIRLARRGRKKLAIYDVVVADARAPRDGRFIEKIGTYNPNTAVAAINLDNDKAFEWLMNGAQPTDTVRAMLSYRGLLYKKHLQIGVIKGAITQEEADKKLAAWMQEKDSSIEGKEKSIAEKAAAEKKARFDAETKVKEARAEAIRKRLEDAQAEAKAAEAPESTEEVAELAEEAPKAEAIEEVSIEEAPKAESTEEAPKAESTEEAPKAEATEEAAEAKSEEKKEE